MDDDEVDERQLWAREVFEIFFGQDPSAPWPLILDVVMAQIVAMLATAFPQ